MKVQQVLATIFMLAGTLTMLLTGGAASWAAGQIFTANASNGAGTAGSIMAGFDAESSESMSDESVVDDYDHERMDRYPGDFDGNGEREEDEAYGAPRSEPFGTSQSEAYDTPPQSEPYDTLR